MPKICDPPPFTGGQSAGVVYRTKIAKKLTAQYGGIIQYQSFDTLAPVIGVRKIGFEWFFFHGIPEKSIQYTSGANEVIATSYIESVVRRDGLPDTGGNPPSTNCYCSANSCRVDCAGSPNGFCCIDHSFTQALQTALDG